MIKQRDEQLLVYSSPGADCQMALLDFFIIDFLKVLCDHANTERRLMGDTKQREGDAVLM